MPTSPEPAGPVSDRPPRPRKRRARPDALARPVTVEQLAALGIADRYPWTPRWQIALETCPRAFYWEAVAARNATRPETSTPEGRVAWALQHLLTLPHLIARLVQSAIRQIVGAVAVGERPPTAARVIDGVCFTFDQTWIGSAGPDCHARFWRGPATYPRLQEFIVGPGLPESARDEGHGRLVAAIQALAASPILEAVRLARRRPLFIGSGFPEPIPVGGAVMGWIAPSLIYDAGPTRRGGPSQWVIGQFELEEPGTSHPLHVRRREITGAATAHWLADRRVSATSGSEAGGLEQPVAVVTTIHLQEGGRLGDARAQTASDAHRLLTLTDAYAAVMAGAGAPPRSLAGAAKGAFPMAPSPSRCRTCRFSPLCDLSMEGSPDTHKVVQPAISSPTSAPEPLPGHPTPFRT